jgi:lipopolysaccharide biosynthesis regulator YciM
MSAYLPLLGVLFALLLGLVVGKAWERYKLRDGRWIDRRRLRETPHYMLGLNFLVDNQVDQAIDELTQATSISDTDALEIQMILGNLYRAKGQVGRAITLHQSLLQRPDLTKLEQAYVQLCLALDFRHGGFVDRALEAFQEVVRLDPKNRYALVNLQKLHEEQRQWGDALRVRREIARLDGGREAADNQILAFLTNEIGSARARNGEADAGRTFAEAIDIDPRTAPAHLNLGDVRQREGNIAGAVEAWESLAREVPDRAYLAFERLERAYATLGAPRRFTELCQRLIAGNPQDWRARLALSKHLSGQSRHREAFDVLLDALPQNPHALAIHQQIWQTLSALGLDASLVRRYTALTSEAVFYLDPHICTRCRYRSTELLWQCPQCHEWNTFVEERLSAATDSPTAELEPTEG